MKFASCKKLQVSLNVHIRPVDLKISLLVYIMYLILYCLRQDRSFTPEKYLIHTSCSFEAVGALSPSYAFRIAMLFYFGVVCTSTFMTANDRPGYSVRPH